MTSKKSKGKGKGNGKGKGKGDRGSFDCVSRKCAAYFAQDDSIFWVGGGGGRREGQKQVPFGDDKQEKQGKGQRTVRRGCRGEDAKVAEENGQEKSTDVTEV